MTLGSNKLKEKAIYDEKQCSSYYRTKTQGRPGYLLFEFSSIGILDFENFQVSVYSTKSEVITNNQG